MNKKASLPKKCPSCSERLQVKRLSCSSCGTEIEGKFKLPEFNQLSEDDQHFILSFVKSGGSLKSMGKQMNRSYAVVRNKLDEIIEELESHEI